MNLKREIPHIIGVLLTGGLWIPFWLIIIWNRSIKRKQDKATKIETLQRKVRAIENSINEVNNLIKELSNQSSLINSFKIMDVSLLESRQLTSVTRSTGNIDATTKTGTVGIGVKIGAVGVGGASSKGKTEGVISSTGIISAGKDEITKIDQGLFVINIDSVSFSGSQFSRNSATLDFIHVEYKNPRIIFSTKNSEKNWLIGINNTAIFEATQGLIEFISSKSDVINEIEFDKKVADMKIRLNNKLIEFSNEKTQVISEIEKISLS
jgi:hypothetical protein